MEGRRNYKLSNLLILKATQLRVRYGYAYGLGQGRLWRTTAGAALRCRDLRIRTTTKPCSTASGLQQMGSLSRTTNRRLAHPKHPKRAIKKLGKREAIRSYEQHNWSG